MTIFLEETIGLCTQIGNIDQKQYVEKVRILIEFIAPHILKEDIEKIWKMQVEFICHRETDIRNTLSMHLVWSLIRDRRSFIHIDHRCSG
jgi:hypothetical protein